MVTVSYDGQTAVLRKGDADVTFPITSGSVVFTASNDDATKIFDGWSTSGWGTTYPKIITPTDGDSYKPDANWTDPPSFTVDTKDIDTGETITVSYGGDTVSLRKDDPDVKFIITSGSVVFTASNDDPIKIFDGWSTSGWGTAYPKIFTPADGASYKPDADWAAPITYTITTAARPGGYVTVDTAPNAPDGLSYLPDTIVFVTAHPDSGFVIDPAKGWKSTGPQVDDNLAYSTFLTMTGNVDGSSMLFY